MTESLVTRLNASSGFETFMASDGFPSLRADTRLMKEAADRIANLERALTAIAYCDTEGHADHEPGGLQRGHMVEIARMVIGHDDGGNDG